MTAKAKEIIINLIERVDVCECERFDSAVGRNIIEADLKEIYENLETEIGFLDSMTIESYEGEIEELEARIEDLEEQVRELASRNEDLADENCKLREIFTNISEAVNSTWS